MGIRGCTAYFCVNNKHSVFTAQWQEITRESFGPGRPRMHLLRNKMAPSYIHKSWCRFDWAQRIQCLVPMEQ